MSFTDKIGGPKEKHNIKMKNIKGVGRLDAQSILELLQIALALKNAIKNKDEMTEHDIEQSIPMMMILFSYLAENMDNPNFDKRILKFLEQLLGLSAKEAKREQELEEEEEQEEELEVEEKERRLKLAIYEMYKVINPHRLAGETELDNFINNVRTRGIKEAMKYEGSEFASEFQTADLENLESHRFSMVKALKDAGVKGGGRGL